VAAPKPKAYPLVPIERLPSPPDEPALRIRGTRIALWRRLRRTLRWLGAGGAALAAAVVLGTTTDVNSGGAVTPLFAVAIVTSFVVLPISLFATVRVLRVAWRLRRTAWQVYNVEYFQLRREQPATMTLVRGKNRYPVKIRVSKRAESLRGMVRDQVWFAGDPARHGLLTLAGEPDLVRHGLLTLAGGGEILWAHPNPTRPARPAKPAKKRAVKPVDPEKARRRAAKIAERDAKAAERAKAWAAKHPPKPRKPTKPQPVRQAKPSEPPKPPRMPRGQKIHWK
jgi:hypothetical protein